MPFHQIDKNIIEKKRQGTEELKANKEQLKIIEGQFEATNMFI